MAIKETSIKAEEFVKQRNSVYRAIRENTQSAMFLLFSLCLIVFIVVTTWNVFTIVSINTKLQEVKNELSTNTVYYNDMTREFENLTEKYKKLLE